MSAGRSLCTKTEFSGFSGRRTQTGTGAPARYGGVGRPEFAYENRIQWVFGQAYANRHRGADRVRGCRPAGVCSQLPAKPYPFVSGSKFFTQLPAEKRGFTDVWTSRFAPRSPRSLIPSFRGANSSHNSRPECAISPTSGPAGLLPAPREALCLRSGEQILHITTGRKMRFRRRPGRPVCSPLPAKPYPFVSGSKFFTQLPAGKRGFAGDRAGRFAPRSTRSLIPSFRGANSLHNFRPESIVTPALGPAGLLPAPR